MPSPPSRRTIQPLQSSTTSHNLHTTLSLASRTSATKDTRRHSHLTRSVTQKENLNPNLSGRDFERAALGISTRSRAKRLGIYLDDPNSSGLETAKPAKTLVDPPAKVRRPLEDRMMSQTARPAGNTASARPKNALNVKRKAGVMLDPTETSPRTSKAAAGGLKRSMVQTKLSFSPRQTTPRASEALLPPMRRETSPFVQPASPGRSTSSTQAPAALISPAEEAVVQRPSDEPMDEEEDDEPISTRFSLRPPTPPRPRVAMEIISTTPKRSPPAPAPALSDVAALHSAVPLTPPPSQPTASAPLMPSKMATPSRLLSSTAIAKAPVIGTRPPSFFSVRKSSSNPASEQSRIPPATPRAGVAPTPGRGTLSTSRFRMYTPGTVKKPTMEIKSSNRSPRPLPVERQASIETFLAKQPEVAPSEETAEEPMDGVEATTPAEPILAEDSDMYMIEEPSKQSPMRLRTPPKIDMPRLDRLSLSPVVRTGARVLGGTPIHVAPLSSIAPGSPAQVPPETAAKAAGETWMTPPSPVSTPQDSSITAASGLEPAMPNVTVVSGLPKPTSASSLPIRRPTSRPIMTTATDMPSQLAPNSPAKPVAATQDSGDQQEVRRKPSYPSSLSLGAGPLARPTARVVSHTHIPSSRSVTQPASFLPKTAASRDRAITRQPTATLNVVPASPLPSTRSVSAPVPCLSASVSGRENIPSDITESLSGLSAALQKLKERPRSMLGPSAPPASQARASLSASVSFHPSAKSSASLSTSTSSRPIPRTSTLADVSSTSISNNGNTSLSSSTATSHALAALVSSSSTSRCLKGVIAYVDVHTADGADSSPLFADMLRSLGARVLSRPTENCTHIVYKSGKPGTVTWWYKQEEPRPHMVGISWVTKSKEKGVRQGEEAYAVKVDEESVWGKRRKTMEPKKMLSAMGQNVGAGQGPGAGEAGKKGSFLDPNAALLQAKRNSLLYTPKVGSPLKKVALRRESDQTAPVA